MALRRSAARSARSPLTTVESDPERDPAAYATDATKASTIEPRSPAALILAAGTTAIDAPQPVCEDVRWLARRQAQVLLDQRLGLVSLVDDDVPVGRLNDTLDLIALMSREDGETVTLAPDALVLIERHQDTAIAPAFPAAFALELELMLRCGPVGRPLVESGDLIVHGPNQAFVSRLPLEPRLHRTMDDNARPAW